MKQDKSHENSKKKQKSIKLLFLFPLRAVTSTKNQQLFEAVALKLWPKSSESPEQCGHEEYLSIEKRLMPHFDNFASLINPNELVEASIYWPPPATATSQVNISSLS